jgi:hypothetical protein
MYNLTTEHINKYLLNEGWTATKGNREVRCGLHGSLYVLDWIYVRWQMITMAEDLHGVGQPIKWLSKITPTNKTSYATHACTTTRRRPPLPPQCPLFLGTKKQFLVRVGGRWGPIVRLSQWLCDGTRQTRLGGCARHAYLAAASNAVASSVSVSHSPSLSYLSIPATSVSPTLPSSETPPKLHAISYSLRPRGSWRQSTTHVPNKMNHGAQQTLAMKPIFQGSKAWNVRAKYRKNPAHLLLLLYNHIFRSWAASQ